MRAMERARDTQASCAPPHLPTRRFDASCCLSLASPHLMWQVREVQASAAPDWVQQIQHHITLLHSQQQPTARGEAEALPTQLLAREVSAGEGCAPVHCSRIY